MHTKRVVSVVAIVLSAVSLGAVGAELRLIDAAKRSDVEAVRALVEQGLDVNARAADGALPPAARAAGVAFPLRRAGRQGGRLRALLLRRRVLLVR